MSKLAFDWKHIAFTAKQAFTETYGFNGSQGMTHLEGVVIRPVDRPSRTLLIFMHPSSTLQLLPLPRAMAELGFHVLCAGSRYQRNDTALIMENVLLDLGAYIRAAKEDWGYERIVLCGWSGGGSLTMLYQSQAERPSITQTPAGDPVDVAGAGLIPADAVLSLAAHASRSVLLQEWLDPSMRNETDPDDRDPELDLYRPGYEARTEPYSPEFVARYRAAQVARMQRITNGVLERLEDLRRRGGKEMERAFVTYRTMADPRFLDPTLEPNGRKPGWSYLGHPETVNSGPAGLGPVLHPAQLAVAVVAGPFARQLADHRPRYQRAVPCHRMRRGRCRAAAAHGRGLCRRRLRRPRDEARGRRQSLLRQSARKACHGHRHRVGMAEDAGLRLVSTGSERPWRGISTTGSGR